MNPVQFEGANLCLKAPEGWDEEKNGPCADLHVLSANAMMHSVWKPSEEELAILNAGGGVVLTIHSDKHPAVSLSTTELQVIKDNEPEDTSAAEQVEDPHPEVEEPRNGAVPLSLEEEHDTIEDIIARNQTRN